MKDPESLLAHYESLDHRLVPERVDAVAADDFPIQSQVEDLEDRYEIIREIARGGQKQVCLAHDRATDRQVALATLHGSASPVESEAFLREARLHASLVHPNVVRVYDLGVLPDMRAFFTMNLMTGRTLADLIDDKRSLPELLEVLLRVCDAIAYAHSRQVLHLDLKPENIQVGSFGDIFVSDWGLARIGEQPSILTDAPEQSLLNPDLLNHFTLSGMIKGTPGYMAPEQARGGEPSVATDVYGLGALLYVILVGEPAVTADTLEEILERTESGTFLPPHERAPERLIPGPLSAVCMRALATDPADRYPTVDELRREILRYRDGFATDAQEASFADHARLLVLRHKIPVALIAVFLAALSVTTLAFIQRLSNSEQKALMARDAAVESQTLAEQAEKKALASLQALETARSQQARLSKMFSNRLLEDSQEIYSNQLISKGTQFQFAAVKEKIDAAIAQSPDDPEVKEQKGFIDFIFQDFISASRAFSGVTTTEMQDLKIFIDKLAADQKTGERSNKELTIHALQNLPKEHDMLARYLFLNAAATKAFAERPAYVEAILARENPELTDFSLKYTKLTPNSGFVDLSSTPNLNTISFDTPPHDHCLLYRLNLAELDLSDTNVSEIASLRHFNRLTTLNLAGAPIRDLLQVSKMPSLTHLTIDHNQNEKIQRYNLRQDVVIEVRKIGNK